jgi:hypothetical protein
MIEEIVAEFPTDTTPSRSIAEHFAEQIKGYWTEKGIIADTRIEPYPYNEASGRVVALIEPAQQVEHTTVQDIASAQGYVLKVLQDKIDALKFRKLTDMVPDHFETAMEGGIETCNELLDTFKREWPASDPQTDTKPSSQIQQFRDAVRAFVVDIRKNAYDQQILKPVANICRQAEQQITDLEQQNKALKQPLQGWLDWSKISPEVYHSVEHHQRCAELVQQTELLLGDHPYLDTEALQELGAILADLHNSHTQQFYENQITVLVTLLEQWLNWARLATNAPYNPENAETLSVLYKQTQALFEKEGK